MSIPIEGLVSREPIQEKQQPSFQEKPLDINGTTPNPFSQVGIPQNIFLKPELFLAMQDLGGRFGSEVPFVTQASKESSLLIAQGIRRTAAPAAAVALVALACTSPASVVDIQNPTGNPDGKPAQQTLPCEPDKELEKFAASIGVPTPIPRGMEGAPTDIVAIRKKLDACLDLTDAEKDALIAFNVKAQAEAAAGPEAAEAPASKPNTPELDLQPKCNIFPDSNLCSTGQIVEWKSPRGSVLKLVGFRLPPGTPIVTPIAGQATKTRYGESSPFQGFSVTVSEPGASDEIIYTFIGDLNVGEFISGKVNAGAVVAYVQDTGIENLGGYNFLVGPSRVNNQRSVTAEDAIEEQFPGLLGKSSTTKSFESSTRPQGTTTPLFLEKAPK